MPTTKRYIVLTPPGIPKGVRIMRVKDQEFYEGDELAAPATMPTAEAAEWVVRGFLKEA